VNSVKELYSSIFVTSLPSLYLWAVVKL